MFVKQTEGRDVREGSEVRVVVVDDDADTRLYFSDLLQATDGFTCADCFPTAAEALSGIPAADPDLVLMDIRMPELDGIECTRRLKKTLPHLRIIIVTGVQDTHSMDECLSAGADAYLAKPVTLQQCVATLKFVSANKNPVRKDTGCDLNSPGPLHREDLGLTARDLEVLELLAQGLLYKEVGECLGLSYSGVRKHQRAIFRKLQVSNRSEATRRWYELGRG